MPTITLRDGDFGSDLPVTVDSTSFYLPDPRQPGVMRPVPLSDVAEMDSVRDDHSGRFKEAARLSVRGVAIAGPAGLAAGLLAARKAKDVVFTVRLHDGRQFTASAGAEVYADLHAQQLASRAEAGNRSEADNVIEKYLLSLADNVHTATLETPRRDEPPAAAPVTPSPPAPVRQRPVFGKRGR